ncbi:MAG: hypothetical protein ACC654_10900 [Acidimicrobiia bacterium]
MKRVSRGMILAVATALLAAACTSGSSDTTTPESTTTTAAPTTTTQAPPTTQATTTTEPSAAADPETLLADVNAAMASQESFLGQGTLTMTDATDEAIEHVRAALRGGQPSPDNSWIVSIMDVTGGELAGSLQWEIREVDGVQYEQSPIGGGWEIDDDVSKNPVRDTLNGDLALADLTAEDLEDGYIITGTYPKDETIEFVSIEVGVDDLLVRSLTSVARQDRSEFAGLVPEGDADIISIVQWEFGDYGIELAPTFEPPVATPTAITRFESGTYQLQIPTAWIEATPQEIADAELDVDRLWSVGEDLLLLVVTDDLIGLGIGTMTLEEYIDFILAEILVEEFIDETIFTVNGQGEDIAIIIGATSPEENPFMRLVSLRDEAIAFNVTVVGLQDAFDENIDATVFMLNSFLINT